MYEHEVDLNRSMRMLDMAKNEAKDPPSDESPNPTLEQQLLCEDDDIIANQYQIVCDRVQNLAAHLSEGHRMPLTALRSDFKTGGIQSIIKRYLTDEGVRVEVFGHREAQLATLGHLIYSAVHETILDDAILFPGLPQVYEDFVDFIGRGLMNLDPPRDGESIQTLKSEIFRALSSQPSAKTAQSDHLKYKISAFESAFVAPLQQGRAAKAIHWEIEELFDAAVRFAAGVRLSPSQYRFVFHPLSRDPVKNLVSKRVFEGSVVVDQDTNRAVTTEKGVGLEVAKDGSFGRRVMELMPGLVRVEGERLKQVVKAVLLVAMHMVVPVDAKTGASGPVR